MHENSTTTSSGGGGSKSNSQSPVRRVNRRTFEGVPPPPPFCLAEIFGISNPLSPLPPGRNPTPTISTLHEAERQHEQDRPGIQSQGGVASLSAPLSSVTASHQDQHDTYNINTSVMNEVQVKQENSNGDHNGTIDGDTVGSSEQQVEYTEGEKILAYHRSLIYEAKILKVRLSNEPPPNADNADSRVDSVTKRYYLIHYAGWNDKWDEWVDASRIMKYTDENKKIQEELRTEYKKVYNNTKRLRGNSADPKSKKRRIYQEKVIDPKFKIEIPYILKKKVIEDWEHVTCQKHLVGLPRTPTVAQTLDEFSQHLSTNSENILADQLGVIQELKTYFDKSLGSLLLYRFERRQYGEILKQNFDKNLCEVYGVEHLLRLCVKIPLLLSTAEPTDKVLLLMKTTITELLKYISNNLPKFLPMSGIYEQAAQQYIKDATS